jgi:hypothetical protein
MALDSHVIDVHCNASETLQFIQLFLFYHSLIIIVKL